MRDNPRQLLKRDDSYIILYTFVRRNKCIKNKRYNTIFLRYIYKTFKV